MTGSANTAVGSQLYQLYPQHLMPIAGSATRDADDFDLAREALLVNYSYNTARAYWGDLEHWRDWCLGHQPATDPLAPSKADIVNYLAEMLAIGYSPNTVARRRGTLRRFSDVVSRGDYKRKKPGGVGTGRVATAPPPARSGAPA